MMKRDLVPLIKREMGYEERRESCCRICKYYKEKDGFFDRTWDSFCTYHAGKPMDLGEFKVKPDSYCQMFSAKEAGSK